MKRTALFFLASTSAFAPSQRGKTPFARRVLSEEVATSVDASVDIPHVEELHLAKFSSPTPAARQNWRSAHERKGTGAVQASQLIGGTPMIDLSSLSANPDVKIYGKCEYLNPSGSIKDRIAVHILNRALEKGELKPGMTVVAATSGNTGAAIAMACAVRGYSYIVITNEKTSKEKIDAMRAYGGEVIVSPSGVPPDSPEHYQNIEATMCAENPNYYGVNQYDNPYNPEAYELTLGPEIWSQTKGEVSHFLAGGSTGGTISGTGRYLKSVDPSVKVILADPKGSVLWDYIVNNVPEKDLKVKSFQVEGVGKDSIPGCFQEEIIDGAVSCDDTACFGTVRDVGKTLGVLLGGSSGLNIHCARVLSSHIKKGVIVTVLPDSGVKYLSKIFNDDWLKSKKLDGELKDLSEYPMFWKPGAQAIAKSQKGEDDALWSSESDEKELQFLGEVADQMVEYHRNSIRGTENVNKYATPIDLHSKFDRLGVSLRIEKDETPTSMQDLASALDAVVDNSVRASHPMFMNQLYAGVDPIALAGEWAASALNSNVHTYEVAPVLTEIERAMLAKVATLWLGSKADGTAPTHDGLFVPGGPIANLYSMILAREKACPEAC